MGERGRLQTNALERKILPDRDLRLNVTSLRSRVELEEPVEITCQLINAT